MLIDKHKIVSFCLELNIIYALSKKILFCPQIWLHALCRVIEKTSNMLRLAIFLVTKLLLRLYIRVHLKSDVMYTVFHLCCEKGAYLSNITKQFLDETPITDKYAILKLYSAS